VSRTNGDAVRTGGMFVRGLVGQVAGIVPFGNIIDSAWLLWDKDAQTLHDKVVNSVVVKAKGSEKIVARGGLGELRPGVTPPPAYAPPVRFPTTSPPSPPGRQADEIYCRNCGQPVKADSQFCAHCGARVAS